MADQNYVDYMIETVQNHLNYLDKLEPAQIRDIILELMNEPAVWNKIASGNREYLEAAAREGTDNYLRGAVQHLAKALPHRMGFIAMELEEKVDTGDPVFDAVVSGKEKLTSLNEYQLIQFLRDYVNSQGIANLERNQGFLTQKQTVNTWIETFDRWHGKNAAKGLQYIQQKKPKIDNLFTKTIFPNLMGAIARSKG